MKVCGKTDPGINDKPKVRSRTIRNWKKFISCFVNLELKWNIIAETGNPTQSKKINALIKSVIKHEIWGNGADSKKSRHFMEDKFKEILKFVPPSEDRWRAMLNCQHQFVGRMDDTAHAKKENLKASTRFKGHLTTKISWSKDVKNNTNSPWHTLLPDMNTEAHPHLSLAIFLERWLECGNGATSQWLFCEGTTTNSLEIN